MKGEHITNEQVLYKYDMIAQQILDVHLVIERTDGEWKRTHVDCQDWCNYGRNKFK